MNPIERNDIGAHYTSEKNILKTINALFLDELRDEFNAHKNDKKYLQKLHNRISKMTFFDPACGCGTFLIIAYRELRKLQIEIHKILRKEGKYKQKMLLSVGDFDSDINVDSMYGIEILEFPVRIAEVALWLVDHQMNLELSNEFGDYYVRLPLKTSPNIVQENALEMDWDDFVQKDKLTCILGNPPFAGKKRRNKQQNIDMKNVCVHIKNYGILDYVCCWYVKSAEFINGTDIKVGLVSTNSITQGEQVGILWDYLLNEMGIKVHFAHRTFKWSNQSKGNAQVYVIIVGFASYDIKRKYLYDYETPTSDPIEQKAGNINPYLINEKDVILKNRRKPISNVPSISFGSMPNDGGQFLFTDSEMNIFLEKEPKAKKFIHPLISAKEFLNGDKRWCLWLKDANPSEIRKLPLVVERIENVQKNRSKSERGATIKLADTPYLFGEDRQPDSGNYILIPLHSSEHRKYIPMDILPYTSIVNNSCSIVKNAELYHFGVLTSAMHMVWVKHVCGRIKSDYRYSNTLVYNNFPWPKDPTSKQKSNVENAVRELLAIRKEYADSSLADLYGHLVMPKKLLNAHKKLDIAVERCYKSKRFNTDSQRFQYLFELYDMYVGSEK
nr:DNA methyltransferase [Methanococcoides seepicolus]